MLQLILLDLHREINIKLHHFLYCWVRDNRVHVSVKLIDQNLRFTFHHGNFTWNILRILLNVVCKFIRLYHRISLCHVRSAIPLNTISKPFTLAGISICMLWNANRFQVINVAVSLRRRHSLVRLNYVEPTYDITASFCDFFCYF